RVFDQANASGQVYTITATTVTRPGAGLITYGAVEGLELNCGSGNDTVNVLGTAAGATTTVNAGAGDDTILVGGGAGGLGGVQGQLAVNGEGGADALTFDDRNATDNSSYELWPSQLIRGSTGGPSVVMRFFNTESLRVDGGQRGAYFGVFGGAL